MKTDIEQSAKGVAFLRTPSALLGLILVLLTLLAYWGVWNCGFVDYDDNGYFYKNQHVFKGINVRDLVWAFTNGETANWHPVTWISLMLDATLFGAGPCGPHSVNLMLHISNSWLLFWLLRFFTGAVWRSFLVAALFALDPMHVESVAWVAERKDVLSAFFFMLTLLAYGQYVFSGRTPGSPPYHAKRWYCVTLVLFALGLMSKPMLVTLPFLLLLLDWWPLHRFGDGVGEFRRTAGRLLKEKIPFFLLSVGGSVVTFLVQREGGAVAKLTQYSVGMRIENAFVSYTRYFIKTIAPFHLAVPYPFVAYWPAGILLVAVVFFLVMSGAAVWLGKRHSFLFTGWFWFVGMLVPVIGLVQVGSQSMADRYDYLPSIGIFILLVWGAERCLGQLNKLSFGALIVGGGIVLSILAIQTHKQTLYWQNDGTLFSHSLAVTRDNYVARIDYGFWLSKRGDTSGAMEQYRAAQALNPADCDVLYNLGNGYAKLGAWDDAIRCYRSALSIKAGQADILNNLGFAFAATQQWAEAAANFERALEIDPDYGDAHNNLASVLFHQADYRGAAEHFYAASRQMPENEQIQVNLGDALMRLGDRDRAESCYRRALEIEPGDERARAKFTALTNPASGGGK
jgi:Tfp pilus assembly protein PilF